MVDRESLLRDAARQQLEMLRSRPRPQVDTPVLTAWFDPAKETLANGVGNLAKVLDTLRGQNRYVEDWRVVRTAQDHDNATGLDPVHQSQEYYTFLRDTKKQSDDLFTLGPLAFSRQIFPTEPQRYSASISYAGGTANTRADQMSFNTGPIEDNSLTLQEWFGMIQAIVNWRRPRIITVGSASYGIYDRVFDHRAWDGWIGWFPQIIDPAILPDFALVTELAAGTIVATQETNVIARDPEHKERANQVEMALADAGILPTNAAIKGDR